MKSKTKKSVLTLAIISASFIFMGLLARGFEVHAESINTEGSNVFMVTVPMVLPFDIDDNGTSIPTTVTIENNSPNTIKISNISTIINPEWTLVEYDKDFSKTPINTKEIALNIFGENMPVSGDLELDFEPEIAANSNISLEYSARIPLVDEYIECYPISVIFTFIQVPLPEIITEEIPEEVPEEEFPVTIPLHPLNIDLYVGDTYDFFCDISNKVNTNPDVADIDENGLITAYSEGMTEITINDEEVLYINVSKVDIPLPKDDPVIPIVPDIDMSDELIDEDMVVEEEELPILEKDPEPEIQDTIVPDINNENEGIIEEVEAIENEVEEN